MKFRIIASLIVLVVLAILLLVTKNAESEKPVTNSPPGFENLKDFKID